jgi:hypothetical protein
VIGKLKFWSYFARKWEGSGRGRRGEEGGVDLSEVEDAVELEGDE